jgi:hypothetical protein
MSLGMPCFIEHIGRGSRSALRCAVFYDDTLLITITTAMFHLKHFLSKNISLESFFRPIFRGDYILNDRISISNTIMNLNQLHIYI